MANRMLKTRRTAIARIVSSGVTPGLQLEALEVRDVPARVWYVAPWGNDGSSGTWSQPAQTVGSFAAKLAPGDEVHFRAGTYRLTVPIELYKSGTATAPIKVMAQPGETVVLDGSAIPWWETEAVGITGDYIQFSGFQVANAPKTGIAVWGGSHDLIANNSVHDSQGAGIYVGFNRPDVVSDVRVEGNTVTHNSLSNSARTTSGGWPAAITVENTSGAGVYGNTVSKNYGEGIDIVLSDGAMVRQNTAFDNYSANYYLDHATDTTVDSNLSYTTNDWAYYRFGLPAVGVQVANEVTKTQNPSNHLRVTNNILLGGRFGFYYGNYGLGGGLRDTLIAGNTIYGSVAASFRIDGDRHTWTTIADNIIEQHGGYRMVDYNGSDGLDGLIFRTNLWYGGKPEVGAGPGDVYADPRFVSPGGIDPSGYRLRADSPAINRASSFPAELMSPVDYFGTARSTTPFDIGASEYVGFVLSASATNGLNLNGTAFARSDSIRLTDTTTPDQEGSAFTNGKTRVDGFSTTFTFQITSPMADGLTFTLQNTSPDALGLSGGGLGYQGIAKSVAVKFDLFNSQGEGSNSVGVYTAGQAPTLGATDPAPWGIDLHSGHVFQAKLDYSGTTLALMLTDTQTGATYRSWYAIDIPGNLGSPTAYVGFTAGTGGLRSITDILNWTYTPTN